nr:hypothetical protein Csa_1G097685 [Tanacetum cinerariifolium]
MAHQVFKDVIQLEAIEVHRKQRFIHSSKVKINFRDIKRRENPPCCIYKRALISVDTGNCLAEFAKSINIPLSFNIEEKILPEATPAFPMSALVRSRFSRVMGTRGAAMKVEMQVVKKEIHE